MLSLLRLALAITVFVVITMLGYDAMVQSRGSKARATTKDTKDQDPKPKKDPPTAKPTPNQGRLAPGSEVTFEAYVAGTRCPNPPSCGPGEYVDELMNPPTGISTIKDLGVVLIPACNPPTCPVLEQLRMEILSEGKLLYTTEANCGGCGRTYSPVSSPGTKYAGYMFVLDDIAGAGKLFVPKNRIVVKATVSGADADSVTFVFVNRAKVKTIK